MLDGISMTIARLGNEKSYHLMLSLEASETCSASNNEPEVPKEHREQAKQ